MPSNLKRIDTRENYENNEAVRRLRHSKDNVPLESIKLDQVIGEVGAIYVVFEYFGAFSIVYCRASLARFTRGVT